MNEHNVKLLKAYLKAVQPSQSCAAALLRAMIAHAALCVGWNREQLDIWGSLWRERAAALDEFYSWIESAQ